MSRPCTISDRAVPCLFSLLCFALFFASRPAAAEARAALSLQHLAPTLPAAQLVGPFAASKPMTLSLVLPLRNRAELDSEIRRQATPGDPLYGHYLTPEQFTEQFGPTQEDVDAVKSFAEAQGLTVKDVSPNRTLVHVTGPVSAVQSAFGVKINEFAGTDGRHFFAPDREPTVTAEMTGKLLSVLGLSNSQKARPFLQAAPAMPLVSYYSGHAGLAPSDVKSIYSVPSAYTGTGQVAAVYEEGTFTASDIAKFFSYYHVSSIPINPVSVDNYSTTSAPGDAAAEVTLDIDMIAGLAPGVSQIRVYENTDDPNSPIGFAQQLTDTFTAMANETGSNRPNVISVSYGLSEHGVASADFNSVDQATAQLARQGQSVCVSSGDAGAYTSQTITTPNASFPASDPYVTCVGGTDMDDTSSYGYLSETSWADTSDKGRGRIGTGGGGGISSFWAIPSWQTGAINTTVNPQGSTSMRNLPDVSLYGDYDTGGYDIYFSDPSNGANWYGYNGTSASSPLWAAFLADVNQALSAKSLSVIGFANPSIYKVAEGANYGSDFHDIKDGSNNLYYNAVTGYDNSTGWGSFIGTNLLTDLLTVNTTNNPPLSGVSASPTSVMGGVANSTGVVALAGKATSTAVISLTSSQPSALSVPSTVTINATYTTVHFTATSHGVGANTTVTITASYGGVSKTTTVTVTPAPPALASVSASPTSVVGGSGNATCVAALNAKATSAAVISLSSSNPSALSVPSTVTINATYTTVHFTATSSAVSAPTTVTITATYNGVSKTTTVTVTSAANPSLAGISATPSSVIGGSANPSVQVALTGRATTTATIALSSSNPAALSVPSSVVINPTYTTKTFTATSYVVTASTTVTITATYNGISQTTTVTVNPAAIVPKSLTFNPNPAVSGGTSNATVTLTGAAPSGGADVDLSYNGSVFYTLAIPAGQTSGSVTISYGTVTSQTTFPISATYNGTTITTNLVVNPPGPPPPPG